MGDIEEGVHFIPALNALMCSLLSSYTLISILDHERWMKEWGDDHEAEAVMHLRTPLLSAAIAMGLGGITTVHQVALDSLHLDNEIRVGANVMYTCLAGVGGVATMFAMLYVARMDAFAGVDRVERLKEVILQRHTISELKLKKGLGKRAAYMGKIHHIVAAGAVLAAGIMGCWGLNVVGLTGEFVVVLSPSGVAYLAVYVLATSIVSCWLLFRVLVWKPSHEYLRPLCSAFFAFSLWSSYYIGKTISITFYDVEVDGLVRGAYGWSVETSSGEWLLLLVTLGAVLTQYAIALELRVAYCGLQDTNIDLQLLAGIGDREERIRKTSAIHNNTSKRRHTGGGRKVSSRSVSRSAPARRRRSVVVHATASAPMSPVSLVSPPGSPMSPGSPTSSTMNLSGTFSSTAASISTSAGVLRAVLRNGSRVSTDGVGGKNSKNLQPRSISVQPVETNRHSQVLVYEPSVAEHPDEDQHHSQNNLLLPTAGDSPPTSGPPLTPQDKRASGSGAGWEVVQPTSEGAAGAMYEVGPLKVIELPDSAV